MACTGALGHFPADGTDGDQSTAGPPYAAGPSQLELARVRDAGWLLAAQARVRAAQSSPTVTLNARTCETYPQVIHGAVDAGWELNAHGYEQMPMHKVDDQLGWINKSVDIIERF
jgi:hypothetical protein